jgi:hypothetical protein
MDTPARQIVGKKGKALVAAMEAALEGGKPEEEEKDVKTAIGAARAKQARRPRPQ